MSNAAYIAHRQYLLYMITICRPLPNIMIQIQVDQLLAAQGRTFYWLAKQTGISHTTLWRLKKDKALGINFETLEKICGALSCAPGDVLVLANTRSATRKVARSKKR